MTKSLLAIVWAFAIGGVNAAGAETWRASLELIDQWSSFTCPVTVSDRIWDLTFDGSQLTASGPEGAKWAAQVNETGSFKATFTGLWRGRLFDAEVAGNAKDKWAILQNKTSLCWYRLERTVPDAVRSQPASEWTSVSALSHGSCSNEALARISEQPGSMRLILVAGRTQFAQFEVALAADGSGRAEYRGNTGEPNRIEIPAGTGKRILRSTRLDGGCQWVWEPN